MSELIYKDEAYEIVYKDAIEWELDSRLIQYDREKEYPVYYKGNLLRK